MDENNKEKIIKRFNELQNKHGIALFCNSKLFNKDIVIMDMEMTGNRYRPEIIEFFGIKINSGKYVDSLYFECKPKNKINKIVSSEVIGKSDEYYFYKKEIIEYKNQLVSFLDNSILCCYDWAYDFKTLIEEYKNKFNMGFSIVTKVIDAAFLLKTFLKSKDNVSLNKNSEISIRSKFHNAIDDVFKLIDTLYDINYFLNDKEIRLYKNLYTLLSEQEKRKEIKEEEKIIYKYRKSNKNKNNINKNKIIYSESF